MSRGLLSRAAAVLRSPRLRLAVLAAVLVTGAVVALVVGGPGRGDIQGLVRGAGPAAPLTFIALYIVLTLLMFPGGIVTAAGGILFGVTLGTVYAVVGASIGATLAFLAGRRLGRDEVEKIAGQRLGKLDRWLERNGFVAILYLRLIPVVPFNVLNYGAGVTGIQGRDYVLATAIGIVPGTFAYAALGGSFDDPTSPVFIAAVSLIVVLAVAGPFVNRQLRKRGTGAPTFDHEEEKCVD